MKRLSYALLLLTPFIYTSPVFQSFPSILRGYLPVAAIFIFFRLRPKWGVAFAFASALVMDAAVAAAIGPYVLLHGLFIGAAFLWRRLIPHPSPTATGVAVGLTSAVAELVFFILMMILGWHISMVDSYEFFTVPLSTGIYAGLMSHWFLRNITDYRVLERDSDA